MSDKPIKKFRAGKITAAVWANTRQTDYGEVTTCSVTFQKSIKDDKTGEWKDTNIFFPDDLPKLSMLAQKAYQFITLKEVD